jgi:hypothetical protein
MNETLRALLLACLALLGSAALAAPATAPGKPQRLTSPDQVPAGLAKSDWQGIRAAYAAGRHEFQPAPLTTDPIAQQAYLKASNTEAGDFFGSSVAVSGDTVVVGAREEASNATGVNGRQGNNRALSAGAAYVFVRSGTDWTQQAYLKASNTGVGDRFGGSVAVSGDTVVVGAPFEYSNATGVNAPPTGGTGTQADNSAGDSGAAYVFVRSGTDWTQQAFLKASNTGANDRFGGAVAVSGDTVVVGGAGEGSNASGVNGNQANNSFSDAGAAYLFTGVGPVTPPVAGLTLRLAPGAGGERRFIATGTPGVAHRLQAAATITGPWTDVPGAGAAGTVAANGELLLEDATPPSDTVFYRAIGP